MENSYTSSGTISGVSSIGGGGTGTITFIPSIYPPVQVCPTCGTCPTCGKRQVSAPVWSNETVGQYKANGSSDPQVIFEV